MDYSSIEFPVNFTDLETADTNGFYAVSSIDEDAQCPASYTTMIEAITSLSSNEEDGIAENLTQHLIDDMYSLIKHVRCVK